jgi:hypothetical protein
LKADFEGKEIISTGECTGPVVKPFDDDQIIFRVQGFSARKEELKNRRSRERKEHRL